MPVGVSVVNVVVVVLPVPRPGVIWWVDVDAVDLASVREPECFEDMEVLAFDYNVSWIVAAPIDRT